MFGFRQLFIGIIAASFIVSCNKDNDTTSTPTTPTIAGTWKVDSVIITGINIPGAPNDLTVPGGFKTTLPLLGQVNVPVRIGAPSNVNFGANNGAGSYRIQLIGTIPLLGDTTLIDTTTSFSSYRKYTNAGKDSIVVYSGTDSSKFELSEFSNTRTVLKSTSSTTTGTSNLKLVIKK